MGIMMKSNWDLELAFKTPHGRRWHICKGFDAFGPTSWCGIERMWRWVEEAEVGQVAKGEMCKVCLRRGGNKDPEGGEEDENQGSNQ